MIKNLLVLLFVCALAYFFYLRDRYITYPVSIVMSDNQNRKVEAKIVWRDATRIQFEKPRDPKLYFYNIDNLNWWSRAKILFLPISQDKAASYFEENKNDISETHAAGLQKELEIKEMQLAHLKLLESTSSSSVEKRTLARDVEKLERKIVEIQIRIQESAARAQ